MTRLKVLFLAHWYPSAADPIGGTFVREHAKAAALHHDVTVLHCAGSETDLSGFRCWRMEQESEHSLTQGIPTYRVWHRKRPLPGTTTALYTWSTLKAAEMLMDQGDCPDVIHAHVYEAGVPAAVLADQLAAPLIVSEHSSDLPRRRLSALQLYKARRVFKRADVVLPVSHCLRDAVQSLGVESHFRIVPNAIDHSLFHPGARSRCQGTSIRLLFVGSLTQVKGLPVLLNALARLRQEMPSWKLDVVGDGPLSLHYQHIVTDLSLDHRVTFHGWQTKHQVADFMRRSDLLVHPSLFETAGCVLIEAMSCGLPVVASCVGGIPEIVHETVGRLCAPGDPEQLADALASAIGDINSFDPGAIVERAQRYGLPVVGSELDLIYQEAVA